MWPQCVSDEHYLPSLLASYSLDKQTDCIVSCWLCCPLPAARTADLLITHSSPPPPHNSCSPPLPPKPPGAPQGEAHYADWTHGGWHPKSFTSGEASAWMAAHMRMQDSRGCRAGTALRSAAGLFNIAAAGSSGGGGSGRSGTEAAGALAGRRGDPQQQHPGAGSVTSDTDASPVTAAVAAGRNGSAAGVLLPRAAAAQLRAGYLLPPWATSALWVVAGGYQPMRYGCPLFARKFGSEAVEGALAMGLSCNGLGLGSWCLRGS